MCCNIETNVVFAGFASEVLVLFGLYTCETSVVSEVFYLYLGHQKPKPAETGQAA